MPNWAGKPLYSKIAQFDEQKIAPGTDLLGGMLQEARPCVVMLDEILVYLIKAGGVRVGEGITALKMGGEDDCEQLLSLYIRAFFNPATGP